MAAPAYTGTVTPFPVVPVARMPPSLSRVSLNNSVVVLGVMSRNEETRKG